MLIETLFLDTIKRLIRANIVSLCINKKADKKYPTYGGDSDLTVFERLSKFKDIVDITYLDGNKNILESICVPWRDKITDNYWFSGETNLNQSSKTDKDDNLEILIKGEHEWLMKELGK